MKKYIITTPENIEIEYELADVGSRTAAAIIDTLIQGGIMLVLLIILSIIGKNIDGFWKKYYVWIEGISILIFGLITYGYYIYMELNMNGQTIGKKIFKLRTIRSNGQPITLKHSAIRNLFRVIIDMYGIGIVLIFFNKNKKRLGDIVASTIVVCEKSRSLPITLNSVNNFLEENDNSKYLSQEEKELLNDYFNKKNTMDNYTKVQQELRMYFSDKFTRLGVINEYHDFINKL